MTEETQAQEINPDEGNPQPNTIPKVRGKRDIFRFNGDRPTAINLDHVTHMVIEGKKITFHFYSTAIYVELEDEAAASSVFEILLSNWSA